MEKCLGLIAGRGRFPQDVAKVVRQRGQRVVAIAFHGETDPALAEFVDRLEWLYLGEFGRLLEILQEESAQHAVMAGKILKTHLFEDLSQFRPDATALSLLAGLKDRKDDSILGAVADAIEAAGISMPPQTEYLPELFGNPGMLTQRHLSDEELQDLAFAWPIAKQIGELDVGQSVVVKGRAVLALEAIEGTDAAIRRGANLGGDGVRVVKVAKPKQDFRFDLPTVGLETLQSLIDVKASALAFEANKTILLDSAELAAGADAVGIAIAGFSETGPSIGKAS